MLEVVSAKIPNVLKNTASVFEKELAVRDFADAKIAKIKKSLSKTQK